MLSIPVVTPALAVVISEVVGSSVQRIEARVEGRAERFEAINALTGLSCADVARSEIMYWKEADNRPDKVGTYRMVSRLVIDRRRLGDEHLFRLAEYTVILICSESLKTRLEVAGFTGLRFREIPTA